MLPRQQSGRELPVLIGLTSQTPPSLVFANTELEKRFQKQTTTNCLITFFHWKSSLNVCSCVLDSNLRAQTACTKTSNSVCEPLEGAYCLDIRDGGCTRAQIHSRCKSGEFISDRGEAPFDELSDRLERRKSFGSTTTTRAASPQHWTLLHCCCCRYQKQRHHVFSLPEWNIFRWYRDFLFATHRVRTTFTSLFTVSSLRDSLNIRAESTLKCETGFDWIFSLHR